MKELEDNLKKINCPKDESELILSTIKTIRMYSDKPLSKDIIHAIYKKIAEIVKDEDQGNST